MNRMYTLLSAASAMLLSAPLAAQCVTVFTEDSVTLYLGYEPLACADLEPWVTGNGPFTYAWGNGATDAAITLCDTASAWYVVNTTDGDGCTATDSVFVNVVDVRCGNNLNKVAVCHIPPGNPANAHAICISANAVPAHLAHGCLLGACAVDSVDTDSITQGGMHLMVGPNPMAGNGFVQLTSHTREQVVVTVVDAMGRARQVVFSGTVEAGDTMQWPLSIEGPATQLMWVRCTAASGEHTSVKVIRSE